MHALLGTSGVRFGARACLTAEDTRKVPRSELTRTKSNQDISGAADGTAVSLCGVSFHVWNPTPVTADLRARRWGVVSMEIA